MYSQEEGAVPKASSNVSLSGVEDCHSLTFETAPFLLNGLSKFVLTSLRTPSVSKIQHKLLCTRLHRALVAWLPDTQ
jgi:hypothetical protein